MKSSRRLTIISSVVLSHHRAYRSVHGGFPSLHRDRLVVGTKEKKSCLCQSVIWQSPTHFISSGNVSVSFSRIRHFLRVILVKSKSFQILVFGFHFLLSLPKDHADAYAFIGSLEHFLHVCKFEVIHPSHDKMFHGLRPCLLCLQMSSVRKFPYLVMHFLYKFPVCPHTKALFILVESIAQKFNPAVINKPPLSFHGSREETAYLQ